MPAAADVLATLHLILQVSFIGVTFLLLSVTVMNRMRVRRVMQSWRKGRWYGVPLWPSLFLGAVLVVFGGFAAVGQVFSFTLVGGYLLGGLFWFTAGLLSGTVLVTEYGIVSQAGRAQQAVAWGQVVDYFETPTDRHVHYVFFYIDAGNVRRRLELAVPQAEARRFSQIVRDKLDARFDLSVQRVYGKKALEG